MSKLPRLVHLHRGVHPEVVEQEVRELPGVNPARGLVPAKERESIQSYQACTGRTKHARVSTKHARGLVPAKERESISRKKSVNTLN